MLQAPQQDALLLEARQHLPAELGRGQQVQRADQLDRHVLLVAAVGAARAIDHAHPAGIQPRQQLVVADVFADRREAFRFRRAGALFEEAAERRFGLQQALHAQA